MNLATLFIMYLIASSGSQTCATSSEEFATEVVIPDYDPDRAQGVGAPLGDAFVFASQYSPSDLLVVVGESSVPHGLAVRIQRPTRLEEIERPHLKFTSFSLPGTVRTTNLAPLYYGWETSCTALECVFEKELTRITASREHPERGVTFEMGQEIPLCTQTCTGICATLGEESRCFSAQIKNDIDVLLRYVNISTNFQMAFNSYRVVGTEGITFDDIVPQTTRTHDWNEAMREELVYLDAQNVIHLTREDIERIAALAREGQAGNNYRIVYDSTTARWSYYNEVEGAVLSPERDCHAYELPHYSPGAPEGAPLNPYYLIPLIIGVSGILMLIVLIVVARIMTSHTRKRQRVHHTGVGKPRPSRKV